MGSFIKLAFFLGLSLVAALADAATLTNETIRVDGTERRFRVHNFASAPNAPLVILLHGGGGSGANMAEQTGFDTVAQREDIVAVYPYGENGFFENIFLTWNAGHCCAYSLINKVDDIGFISQLIDYMIATHKVDPQRVYVSGLSNGGMMSHRVGIELSTKVAAIAPVIASLYGDEPVREIALPVLIINGNDDQRVKVQGGELQGFGLGNNPADLPTLPISSQRDYWAKVNGCSKFTDTSTPDYDLRSYQDCRTGGAVQSYVVKNHGHAWPGGTAPRADADQPVQTVNANQLLWDFFKQYKRSPGTGNSAAAYYYVGRVTIPAFASNGLQYGAQLVLLPGTPMQFSLAKLTSVDAGLPTGDAVYVNGVLTLPDVVVGNAHRAATLRLTNTTPPRLTLETFK